MLGQLGDVDFFLLGCGRDIRELRASDQAARNAQHHLAEIPTIHGHVSILIVCTNN
jgi:hypothetical protein